LNPSRTTVDQSGSVWVTNRSEFGLVDGQAKGSVVRVGLVIGGTRANADGSPNPVGDYLGPPIQYNTCVDRDSDGLIKTSRGLTDIRPWTNPGGVDDLGGVSSAEDECIIDYTRVEGTGTRHLSVDVNNDVWVGGLNNAEFEKLDGITGQPVAGSFFDLNCGGYGGLIDQNGVIWSARNPILRFVPAASHPPAGNGQCLVNLVPGAYGMGVDPNTGHVWVSELGGTNRVYEIDESTNLVLNSYPQPFNGAQGLAVDGNSHVWVAQIFGGLVAHYAPNPAIPGTHLLVGVVSGFAGTTGVAVDANGKIWASETGSSATRGAARIDPNAGPVGAGGYNVGAIDMTVGLGPGGSPYNYSDMTGFVAIGTTIALGSWSIVQDGTALGTEWGTVTWNNEPEGNEPDGAGSNITVEARASDTEAGLSSETFVSVTNGVDFSVTGRFIEVRATLTLASDGTSPVLSDLTIDVANDPPVCSAAAPSIAMLWPPNHKFVPITVQGVTDPDGDPITINIDAIWQDEPTDTFGDGKFTPDGTGVGTSTAEVRAERSGSKKVPGDGRVYHISFTASDDSGASCSGEVLVGVPHDQRGTPPVDGGPLYDSTS
jgi:hypothetical protein